jgi:hypothetical protein
MGDEMAGTKMAKKRAGRSPKNKERLEPGFRTMGIRMSEAYADWLAAAARHDRVTIAGFVDRAVVDRAKALGFDVPPPERIP